MTAIRLQFQLSLRIHLITLIALHSNFYTAVSAEALCDIPFAGKWTENDKQLVISQNHWGNYGGCVEKKGEEQYLFRSNSTHYTCYRCLIVFPVHGSILQYKATHCLNDDSMSIDRCREKFRGDAQLNTVFKVDAPIESCPLEVPLNFTFSTSHGNCVSRTSTVHQCAQDKRLRIQYEACPELPHREARGDELECIATWYSLGSQFFAARLVGKRTTHRCYIIDRSGSSGRIAVSADSSCQELTHLSAATTILDYKQDAKVQANCHFPEFLLKKVDLSNAWDGLVNGHRHRFKQGEWTISHKGRTDAIRQCIKQKIIDDETFYMRVHVTHGCHTGFQCVKITHTRESVVQLSLGVISANEYEECEEMNTVHRDTIVRHGTKYPCPLRGRQSVSTCTFPILESGCVDSHQLLFRKTCEIESEQLDCIVSWNDEDLQYLIVKHPHSHKMHCFVHSPSTNRYRMYNGLACEKKSIHDNHPFMDFTASESERCETSLLAGFLYSSSSFSGALIGQDLAFQIYLLIFGLLKLCHL